MIAPQCCYTCQALQVDSDGWFCTLEGGPRWAEFDMPFRHVSDGYVSREEFHPHDVEGDFDVDELKSWVDRARRLKDDLSQIPGVEVK